MKKLIVFYLLLFLTSLSIYADRQTEYQLLSSMGNIQLPEEEEFDMVLPNKGYKVRLIGNQCSIKHIGLNLFNDQIKVTVDKELLDFVETALLAKVLGEEIEGNTDFLFFGGDINSLKKISPETECKISNYNSKYLSFEWELIKGKILRMDVPVSYNNAKGGSRSEIEDDFIAKIKKSSLIRNNKENFDLDKLVPYGKELYILPGETYLNNEINRNLYYSSTIDSSLIYDKDFPVESISNLFIYPLDENGIINIDITISKHDYGKKETFSAGLENFLALCEKEGCVPYWGLENYDGKFLTGSLFLNNWKQGYNHVLKITCNPEEVISGQDTIKAKASLFIPTNNINSLYGEDELTIIK